MSTYHISTHANFSNDDEFAVIPLVIFIDRSETEGISEQDIAIQLAALLENGGVGEGLREWLPGFSGSHVGEPVVGPGDLTLDPEDIPADFEVQPLSYDYEHDALAEIGHVVATCGTCDLSWDDSASTGLTPVPSGRCPFEHFHIDEG